MNIFVVDPDPRISARMLCDKHVNKMVTESVQLLSNAMWFVGLEGPYRKTHWNHPPTVWVRESLQNYQWLWNHADELGNEFTRRYINWHLAHKKLKDLVPIDISLPDIGLTPFANVTPYKHLDTIEAYHKFYRNEKSRFAKWKDGNEPVWYYKEMA